MYYVEINNKKITGKFFTSLETIELTNNQKVIDEDLYNELVRLPATYLADKKGKIISITNAPEPEKYQFETDIDEETKFEIRKVYTLEEELKAIRKGISNPKDPDFIAYNELVQKQIELGHEKKVKFGFKK